MSFVPAHRYPVAQLVNWMAIEWLNGFLWESAFIEILDFGKQKINKMILIEIVGLSLEHSVLSQANDNWTIDSPIVQTCQK